MITRGFRKGQSIVEYTMLIIIVAAALAAMSTYIMRSMNARLKAAQKELDYYRQDEPDYSQSGTSASTGFYSGLAPAAGNVIENLVPK